VLLILGITIKLNRLLERIVEQSPDTWGLVQHGFSTLIININYQAPE